MRIFGCANAVTECSDFLTQLCGFIPEKPGRYRLKRKHTIVENIPNSEAYIAKRKKSYGADIMDYENDSNYTNVVTRDLESLTPKNQQLKVPNAIIKFDKNPTHWYTLWDGLYIRKYNGEKVNRIIAMRRYLDTFFDQGLANSVLERYDLRIFKYADMISLATFAADLKLIKSK